ncbi:MAG: hypothetical protein M3Z25_10830 [Actinomycetota bacterium]|nr:hypothetical protein [Actinomycetota bacterium]
MADHQRPARRRPLGLIDTSFGKGDEAALARQAAAAAEKGPVLVCWQHGEIPATPKPSGNRSRASCHLLRDEISRQGRIFSFRPTASDG